MSHPPLPTRGFGRSRLFLALLCYVVSPAAAEEPPVAAEEIPAPDVAPEVAPDAAPDVALDAVPSAEKAVDAEGMSVAEATALHERKHKASRERKPLGPHQVVGDEATGFATRGFGARGQMTFVPTDPVEGGAAFQMRSFALLFGPVVSAIYLDRLWIGGDSDGVTYSLAAQLGIGVRYEFETNHGPFARVEMRGEMMRAGGWYQSSLRLPGAQVGWGMDIGDWMIDAFAHGSPSLTGWLKSPAERRDLRGIYSGGAFTLGWTSWVLQSDASHLFDGKHGEPLWDLRSSLCSYWWKTPTTLVGTNTPSPSLGPRSTDYKMGICLDGSALKDPKTANFLDKADVGLTVVFGRISRVDRSNQL